MYTMYTCLLAQRTFAWHLLVQRPFAWHLFAGAARSASKSFVEYARWDQITRTTAILSRCAERCKLASSLYSVLLLCALAGQLPFGLRHPDHHASGSEIILLPMIASWSSISQPCT